MKNAANLNPDPWYAKYHFSHPQLVERLKALNYKPKEKKQANRVENEDS